MVLQMGDRPSKRQLLEAVQRFLGEELVPSLEGVQRFHARVAANALAIVARELELEAPALSRLHVRLAELLGCDVPLPDELAERAPVLERMEADLCDRIRAGDADEPEWRVRVIEYVRESVRERLAINNPSYR